MSIQHEQVCNWMSKSLIVATPSMLLEQIYHLMIENQVRRIPIVAAENGEPHLMGIVTYGDVRAAVPSTVPSVGTWEKHYLYDHLTAEKFMSPNPITIPQTATIGQAAHTMLENRISGLPVINEAQQLVGIITESDIFRMVIQQEWRQGES